jgi:hypothetical protein
MTPHQHSAAVAGPHIPKNDKKEPPVATTTHHTRGFPATSLRSHTLKRSKTVPTGHTGYKYTTPRARPEIFLL